MGLSLKQKTTTFWGENLCNLGLNSNFIDIAIKGMVYKKNQINNLDFI